MDEIAEEVAKGNAQLLAGLLDGTRALTEPAAAFVLLHEVRRLQLKVADLENEMEDGRARYEAEVERLREDRVSACHDVARALVKLKEQGALIDDLEQKLSDAEASLAGL